MSSSLVTALVNRLDPAGCEVINLPDRIWVFGGIIKDAGEPAGSLRDCFCRRTLEPKFDRPWAQHLARPEDFDDWWAFSGYSDLLSFERDASFLARAIILFVESPGSIAELGCMASHESILPRVMTVVQRRYHEERARRSYLRLGPLDRVQRYGTQCVIGTALTNELPSDDFEAILETIDDKLSSSPPQRVHFDPSEPAHIILLTADLVDLLLISKPDDIDDLLRFYSVRLDGQVLSQYLELLSFFNLIRKEIRGKEVFWVRAPNSDAPWVDHKANGSGKFVRERFKIDEAETFVRGNARLKSVYGRLHAI